MMDRRLRYMCSGVNIEGALNQLTGSIYYSGTSMATPHVVGVVCLLYQIIDSIVIVKRKLIEMRQKGIIENLNPGDNTAMQSHHKVVFHR